MIIKEIVWIEPFQLDRMLHIYVPDHLSESERCGVIYMFDGHNLFSDEDATYGKSWGLLDYLETHQINAIVVGIECNHADNHRLWEFSPYDFDDLIWGSVKGHGKIMIDWIIQELKPYIDDKLNTLKDSEHTAIGGSSMGGLMALYGASYASHVFSKAICKSVFYEHIFEELKNDIQAFHPKNISYYLSWGAYEFERHEDFANFCEQNLTFTRMLSQQNQVFPHLYVDQDHSEQAWSNELDVWMSELKIKEW